MSKDFSERVKKAVLSATYELCGYPNLKDFPSKTQAFLPASLTTVALSGLNTPDEYESPKAYQDALAVFNLNFFNAADQMPNLADVFWAGGVNSRSANLGTFLNWVDTGAKENQQYKNQYVIRDRDYRNAMAKQISDINAAYALWVVKNPNGSTDDFKTWLYTKNFSADIIKADDQEVNLKKSAFDNIAKLRYGPLGAERSTWLAKQNRAVSGFADVGFTMATPDGFKPLYNLPRSEYESWYSNAMSSTLDQSPEHPKWAAVKALDTETSTQVNVNDYGFSSTDVGANLFVADPFLFWAEGDIKTSKERWSAYESNNIQKAVVKLCSWSTPKVFQVSAGAWLPSDPTLTFPNYNQGAPSNMKGFVYPCVAQIAVSYGIGYEFVLDKSSFNSMYEHVYSSTEKRVIGIFDWVFSLEGSLTQSDKIQTDKKSLYFDRANTTVRVMPEFDSIPVVLGVVVNKGPQQQQAVPGTAMLSHDVLGHERVTSFLDNLSTAISPFSLNSRLELSEFLSTLLDQGTTEISPRTLAKILDRITILKKTSSEDDSNEINISQTTEYMTTVVSVRSSSRVSSSNEASKSLQEYTNLANAALSLMPFLSRKIAGGSTSQLLLAGLSSIIGTHTSPEMSEIDTMDVRAMVTGHYTRNGSLHYHKQDTINNLEEWWDPNMPFTFPPFTVGTINITLSIEPNGGGPKGDKPAGPIQSIELEYVRRDNKKFYESHENDFVYADNNTKIELAHIIDHGNAGNPYTKIRLWVIRETGARVVSIPYEIDLAVM